MPDPITPQAPAKTKQYRALTPVDFNGKRVEIDKTLRLDDETAEPLLAVKAIELVAKDKEDGVA